MEHLFDDLARKLAAPTSRRTSFRLILGAAAAGFLAACNVNGCASGQSACGSGSRGTCCDQENVCCNYSNSPEAFCCSATDICCVDNGNYCCGFGTTCNRGTCLDPSGIRSPAIAPHARA